MGPKSGSVTPSEDASSFRWNGKFPFELRGREAIYGGVMLLLAGALVAVAFHSFSLWGDPINLKVAIAEHEKTTSEKLQKVADRLDENTYVNSVCFNPRRTLECERLNLQMPESLRGKIRPRAD